MNSTVSASMQPIVVSVNPTSGGSSSSTILTPPPMTYPPNSKAWSPEEEEGVKKQEYEPEFRECFSKSMLRLRLKEFWGGKVTQKYVETYLDFMHLSGMIDNLEFLEYKNALTRGQL